MDEGASLEEELGFGGGHVLRDIKGGTWETLLASWLTLEDYGGWSR